MNEKEKTNTCIFLSIFLSSALKSTFTHKYSTCDKYLQKKINCFSDFNEMIKQLQLQRYNLIYRNIT